MHDTAPPPVDTWTRLLNRSGAETAFYRSSVTHLDGMGNPVEEIHFGPEGAIERKRTFDPGGKVLEETAYNPDGSVDYRLVYHYDAAGKEVEQILVLSDGKEHGRWVGAYDASGRLGERTWYNREGRVKVAETFVYDEAGGSPARCRGNVASWTYHYNEDGRLVSNPRRLLFLR